VSSPRSVAGVVALLVFASVLPGLAGGARTDPASSEPTAAWTGEGFGPDRGIASFDGSNETDPAVVQTVTYRQAPNESGTIHATHRYRVRGNVSTIIVYDYDDATVVNSRGFDRRESGRWAWDGETAAPTLQWETSVNRTSRHFEGLRWVDVGNWTLANPRTDFVVRDADHEEWVYSWQDTPRIDQRSRVAADADGFAGPAVVYLGPFETTVRNATDQRFRLIRPESARLREHPDRIMTTLASAAQQLRVGARDETVNVFVGPDPLRYGGTTASGIDGVQDVWVSARADAGSPPSTWIHEYVHTRQSFVLGDEMTWFREASASYYAAVCAIRTPVTERTAYRQFLETLRQDHGANATLSDRSSWSNTYVPYAKGTRVLAALDARIRTRTNGTRTLQTVFRRLNEHDGVVTYDVFATVVGNVTGESQRAWLDDHVRDGREVSPPESPFKYVSPGGQLDADGDGLSANTERRAGTHPFVADTDADGVSDGTELRLGTNPSDPFSRPLVANGTDAGAESDEPVE